MRLKEFLSVRGIEFQSVNILEDAAGLAELRRLGARTVPVLSRGDKYVFAQNIAQVVEFLKLDEKTGPVLSPEQLVDRLGKFLGAAEQLVPLMPDDRLDTEVPNRPRSYRVLSHHLFRIAEAFLEVTDGSVLSVDLATNPPPAPTATASSIAAYGHDVHHRLDRWWATGRDREADRSVETYYGPQKLHDVLERTTWHVGQHARQWMMLLENGNISFERPLHDADFVGLPMPKSVWDG